MRRVTGAAIYKCARLYSHAETLGDGISASVKLTPANVVRVGGAVCKTDSHVDTKLHCTALDNGTRVMSKDLGGNIARLTFLYKDGPVYEDLFTAGSSQFMKHMLNKDSITSSEYVTKTILQKSGIILEAPDVVNKSWISFSCEGFRDSVCQADVTDKLWQSILFPRMSPDNLKECKRLIELENGEVKRDSPRLWVLDLLHKSAFKGSPLGHSLYCPSYNLKYFKSEKLFERWDSHYGFKNIAIVATNVDHHDLVHALQDSVWVARAHNKEGGISAIPSTYVGGEGYDVAHRAVEFDDQFTEVYQTYTGYAFKAPGWTDLPQWAAAKVVASALSIATSQILRNSYAKNGVDVFYNPYKQTGLLGMITVGATAPQLKSFRAALESLGAVSDSDAESLKNAAALEICNTFESRKGCQKLLTETFTATGMPCDVNELVDAIKAVKAQDLKAVVDASLSAPASLVHYGDSPAAPTLADLK